MSILNNSLLLGADAGAAGYQISRSLRFNSADSAYLSRTPASAGNRRTFTVSFWIKKCRNSLSTSQYLLAAGTGTSESTWFAVTFDIGTSTYDELSTGTWTSAGGSTNASLRDSSAWYHIVVSVDTTQATASNRVKTYVNNVLQSTTTVTISQNADLAWNNNVVHYIGARADSGPRNFFDGYIADFHNIDGQALTPSSFAETNATTGQWVPKAYTGTYGTNGFRLDFSDNSAATATTLGKDRAGSNNWTPNNLSVTAGAGNDSLVDTPTSYGTDTGAGGEVRGNYATFNLLASVQQKPTVTDGNLKAVSASGTQAHYLPSTVAVNSGKWYAEFTIDSGTAAIIGAVPLNCNFGSGYLGSGAGNGSGYATHGYAFNYDNAGGIESSLTTATTGDIIGVALDLDDSTGKLFIYKNGSKIANAQSDDSFTTYNLKAVSQFWTISIGNNATWGIIANFGQRSFAYTAPSGFKALCDTNLPAPVVAKPSTVMDVILRTGTGSSGGTVSGLNFSPDLIWEKARNNVSDHFVVDAVRGINSSSPYLRVNNTNAESSLGSWVTSTTSTGYTINSNDYGAIPIVSWCWDAGSSTVTNTQGSITSQVRANASAGFSIVTYTGNATTGATVGHGLGVAPGFVIIKDRSAAFDWRVWTTSFGTGNALSLNSTAATSGNSPVMQAAPNSTVMSLLGSGYSVNNSGNTYVAYCFAPVAGYSAFGSYTGNGTSDGPFVYTGFRPKYLLYKRTDSANSWIILDAMRSTYNVTDDALVANLADAEYANETTLAVDMLSNGFKIRTTGTAANQSPGTYIYAAFAENPFQYARAR